MFHSKLGTVTCPRQLMWASSPRLWAGQPVGSAANQRWSGPVGPAPWLPWPGSGRLPCRRPSPPRWPGGKTVGSHTQGTGFDSRRMPLAELRPNSALGRSCRGQLLPRHAKEPPGPPAGARSKSVLHDTKLTTNNITLLYKWSTFEISMLHCQHWKIETTSICYSNIFQYRLCSMPISDERALFVEQCNCI